VSWRLARLGPGYAKWNILVVKKLLDDAVLFAAMVHFGRRRRYTNLPHLGQCLDIMEVVASVEHKEAMLIGSLLHDVLEYPGTAVEELVLMFGPEIAKMVVLLGEPKGGDRKTRLALVAKRLASNCSRGWLCAT
jgi:(p)ppGpp synthase/HD superfamily hydrolase